MSLKTTSVLLVLLVAVGLGALQFPAAANWVVQYADREETFDIYWKMSETAVDAIVVKANEYNDRLRQGLEGQLEAATDTTYQAALRPSTGSSMGKVVIPKIGVSLNIFHDATDALTRGAGHMYGTSLPVGGPDTHTAIAAHSGMASAARFTKLNALEIGDTFTLITPGNQAYYRVDHIQVVPAGTETRDLAIIAGEDHATLITCTPTGINTHRLMVRGVAFQPDDADLAATALATNPGFPWWAVIWAGPTAAVAAGAIWLNKWSAKQKAKAIATIPVPSTTEPKG